MAITKVTLIADSTISDVHINTLTTNALTEGDKLFYTNDRVASYLAANNFATTGAGYFYDATLSANILTFSKSDGTTDSVDLSLYLDDTNLARLVSGTLDGLTGIATFTRDDSSTFTIDFSAFLADANDYVSSGSFNTTTGVLTLTRLGGGTVTVDLDGKYAEASHTHLWSHITDRPTALSAFTNDLGNYGGFLTSFTETDPIYTASSWYTTTNNSTNWNTAYGWGNHASAGYLTSFTETDPIYTASSWYTTTNNAGNWNTAYGWGNHASAGYLTSFTESDPVYTSERDSLLFNKMVHATLLFSNLSDYNRPSGYSTMIQPGSYQNPIGTHGYYHIIARRDAGGGYGALLQSYNGHEIYHGNTTESTSNINWYKIWTSGDFSSTNVSNWNTAYGWGNHASAGYQAASTAITTSNIGSQSVSYASNSGLLSGYSRAENGANIVLQTASNGYLYINNWIHPNNGAGLFYDSGPHFYESGATMYSSHTLRSGVSLRAPIFYDENDTGYYLDPASTGTALNINGGISTPTMWVNQSTGNYNNYNENIRLFPAGNSVSVIAFGASGTGGTPWNSILGYSDRFEIRQGGQWQQRNYANYVEAYGSFRSPIFYDSNDTGYYVDPNGTTNINKIIIGGKFVIEPTGWSNADADQWPYFYWQRDTSNGWDEGLIKANSSKGFFGKPGWGIHMDSTKAFHIFSSGWTANFGVEHGGTAIASGSFRAPIFYDSNDTGYYINPASTSRLYNMEVNFHSFPYREWDFNWGSHGANNGMPSMSFAMWDNYTQSGAPSSYGTLLDFYGLSGHQHDQLYFAQGSIKHRYGWYGNNNWNGWYEVYTSNNGSMQTPILYDSNNTNYFLNPDGTSEVNTIVAKSCASNYYGGYYVSISPYGFNTCNVYGETVCGGGANLGIYNSSCYANYKPNGFNVSAYSGAFYEYISINQSLLEICSGFTGEGISWNGGDGHLCIGGTLYQNCFSDCRYKTNITPIESALDKIDAIRGVEFDWNELGLEEANREGHEVGVIAQEVQSVYPIAVREVSKERTDKVVTGLVVDYEKLIPLLVQGIKELRQEINDIKQQINGGSI